MKLYIVYLILFTVSMSVFSQSGSIKGRVFNEKTNEPLEFATVQLQGTTIGSTTDLDGNFIFTGVNPGFVRLVVSFVGFQTTVSSEIYVQGNQTAFVEIPVPEASIQISEVVVRSNLNVKRIESPLSVLSVGIQQIEKTAGANRDISKVIQTLPGVGVTDPNRNDLIVRGGGPSENVFYLDGIEIPIINHFATQGSSGGAIGIINPDFIREIDFYTGAFPSNRPNALSSVMELKQKDGSLDRLHAKFSIGASDAAFTLDGPIGEKSNFIFSARQSYLKFLFKAVKLPFLPTYNDFQFKYKYKFNRKNEITFIGLGAIDNMTLNTELQETGTEAQIYLLGYLPIYRQWNYVLGAVYKHFGNNYYDTWVLSRNMLRNNNFKYQNNDETLPKILDYTSDEAENKFRFERVYPDLPVKLMFGAGLKWSNYSNETKRNVYFNDQLSDFQYQTNLSLFGYQAFAQVSDSYFDEKLKLSLGVSAIGNNFNENLRNPLNQLAPRFSLSYQLTKKWDINGNISRYAMLPAYTTMGFKNNAGEYVNKNANLKSVVSNQTVLGFDFRPENVLRFTAEGFFKQYQNYPLSVADGLSIASKGTDYGQIGDEEIVSIGKGRSYGFELQAKVMEWENLNTSLSYTFFRSEFTDRNDIYRPSSWDTRHILNLIGSVKFHKNWNVAGRWYFVGGAPYSPIDLELSKNKAAWSITNQAYIDYANFNSLRLKNSHQLDIRIDKEFYLKKWVLNLYADVQNVYNFKSQYPPIYTNKDKNGQVMDDPANPQEMQLLREIEVYNGFILPTIGIIVKI